MSKVYDTSFLRKVAASVLDSGDHISMVSKNALSPMEADIPQQLDGAAAAALEEAVGALKTEIAACSKNVNKIGAWLNHYANELDEADQKTAELFVSR